MNKTYVVYDCGCVRYLFGGIRCRRHLTEQNPPIVWTLTNEAGTRMKVRA